MTNFFLMENRLSSDVETMIFGEKLPFEQLIDRIHELEKRFHNAV